jgi:8-oxo-dGTP pyrophosphatase MutT (NUDIX family)
VFANSGLEYVVRSPGDGAVTNLPRLRPAVRALLADPEDRVLMVRWAFRDGGGVWGLPGGGIDPGETHAQALRRELLEEVGLDLPEDRHGPCVGHRRHLFDIGGGYDGQEEWFYHARVDTFEPRGALSAAQLAAEGLVEIRWMRLGEVHALPDETSGERVFLRAGAADFTARLLQHGHPDAPVELRF